MSDQRQLHIYLDEICKYLDSSGNSRCLVEGQKILIAKHIIVCGIISATDRVIEVFALCLQTSAMKSSPHEIQGKFRIADEMLHIESFTCSCKAGLSGKCKHISGVLQCSRSNIFELETLSSTDLKCYWTTRKKELGCEYEAKPLMETSCFSEGNKDDQLMPEQQNICRNALLKACSSSALSLHIKGRKKNVSSCKVQINVRKIIEVAECSLFLPSFNIQVSEFNLKACCREELERLQNCNILELAVSSQRSKEWYGERQFRITGSRCYSIYSYTDTDWETKSTKYFWPKSFNNKYVEHGRKYESDALIAYKNITGYEVSEVGLVVCKQYPWLGVSPDGVAFVDGQPSRLLEIKCPYSGLTVDAIDLPNTCPYLKTSSEGEICMRSKHPYYAQIQMGMAVLNLKICDFILYSAKSKTFLHLVFHFDEVYATSLIKIISENYLNFMIHEVCKGKNNV